MALKKTSEPRLTQCNVRMPPPVLDDLDEWVAELNAEARWAKFTRSDLMRQIVEEAVATRKAAKSAPAPAPQGKRKK